MVRKAKAHRLFALITLLAVLSALIIINLPREEKGRLPELSQQEVFNMQELESKCNTGEKEGVQCCFDKNGVLVECKPKSVIGSEITVKLNFKNILENQNEKEYCIVNYLRASEKQKDIPVTYCYSKEQLVSLGEMTLKGMVVTEETVKITTKTGTTVWEWKK